MMVHCHSTFENNSLESCRHRQMIEEHYHDWMNDDGDGFVNNGFECPRQDYHHRHQRLIIHLP